MRVNRLITAALLIGSISIFAAPQQARATLVVYITVGTNRYFVADNSAPYPGGGSSPQPIFDENPLPGIIEVSLFSVADFFATDLFIAEGQPGTAALFVRGGEAGNATEAPLDVSIFAGDNNFVAPVNAADVQGVASYVNNSGIPNGSFSWTYFDDPANAQPLMGPVFPPPSGQIATNTQAMAHSFDVLSFTQNGIPVSDQGPFAMTLETSFTLEGASLLENFSSLENKFTTVPEPATLALLGLGLSGLVFTRRRKH